MAKANLRSLLSSMEGFIYIVFAIKTLVGKISLEGHYKHRLRFSNLLSVEVNIILHIPNEILQHLDKKKSVHYLAAIPFLSATIL